MLGIMAGLDQKDCYAVVWPRFSSTTALVCTWLVFLVTLHLALYCLFIAVGPQDAPHHGWYDSERQLL